MSLTLRRASAVLTLLLVAGLSACSDSESSADPSPSAPESSESESPSPTESDDATTGVATEDALGYSRALITMGKQFQTFSKDFSAAVAERDDQGVLRSASNLRDAVSAFDEDVRALDLSAVQQEADRVLTIDGKIIDQLDEVEQASNGPEAIRMLNKIDFQEFTQAFTDLGQQITAEQE